MRLIDADALMKTLGITDMDCEKCEWQSGYGAYCSRGGDFEDACSAIEDAPTIDAVEVVRCKDCRYSDATINGGVYCLRTSSFGWTDESFCSDGEKE